MLSIENATVRCAGDGVLKPADMKQFAAGASVLVTMYHDRVDADLLDAIGSQIKGVCNFAVGFNNIDLEACRQRGVVVTNTPNAVTEGTADLAWALLLAVARGIVPADRYARSRAYPDNGPLSMSAFSGADLTGRNLLIVGAGRIGFGVAMRSLGWGMRVQYVARSRHWDFELAPLAAQRVSLEEGLRNADVVSLHVPLSPATTHLIDAKALSLMKPNAILINTARGPIVDEAALAQALKENRIYGAGLDVYEREPEVYPGLLDLDNVTLTPHIGSAEVRYREMMTDMVSENVNAILAGKEPPNRIA
ncbi:MAG: D-glycerate dehydrogenase [Phycisphaeraceae bacterium]|nr:D-glycerate dehydrogenase [Phycisphaeraceae bacterium]